MDLRASPFLFKLLSATVLLGGGLIGVQACKPRAASRIASNPAQQAETKDEKVATLPDPAAPGDNNPPAGTRSFFDQVMTVDGKVVIPWPMTELLKRVEEVTGIPTVKVVIPGSRSLQRLNSTFKYPRLVFTTQNPQPAAGARMPLPTEGKIFIGYSEYANEIEVISWNEGAGRFEFQLIHNYTSAGQTPFYTSRDVCAGCHHNLGPIFPDDAWSETTGSSAIAKRVVAARGSDAPYHGARIFQNSDDRAPISRRFDEIGRGANGSIIAQVLWARLCAQDAAPTACRQKTIAAAMGTLCLPKSVAPPAEPPFESLWSKAFPEGALLRSSVIKDREPMNLITAALPVAQLPPEAGERPPVRAIPDLWDPEVRGNKTRETVVEEYKQLARITVQRKHGTKTLTTWLADQLQPYAFQICANFTTAATIEEAVDGAAKADPYLISASHVQPHRIAMGLLKLAGSTSAVPLAELPMPTGDAPVEEGFLPTASDPNVGLFVTYCARCHQNREPILKFPETNIVQVLKGKEWRDQIRQRVDWMAIRTAGQEAPQSAMPRRGSKEFKDLSEPSKLADHKAMLDYLK